MIEQWQSRIDAMRTEWLAIAGPTRDDRFAAVKAEAEAIIDAGKWMSGPSDLLSVLRRHRDELMHSLLIAWLLVPTNRHGLGRHFLRGLLEHVWPGEPLLRRGSIRVDVETSRAADDDAGVERTARADIVAQGDGLCLVIENKVDAGEQLEQCERLYWAWADQPIETRWLFITPTGREPVTAISPAARDAWRTLSYTDLREILATAIRDAQTDGASTGRSSAAQYLATLGQLKVF